MRKTYPLRAEGKHPDRVLDAVKNDIRKYLKRERRRALPEGTDFLDFDCKFGLTSESAAVAHLATVIPQLDAAAREGAESVYVEILARAAKRKARPAGEAANDAAEGAEEPGEA